MKDISLNEANMIERGKSFIESARELSLGRYQECRQTDLLYHTVGYEVSTLKAENDAAVGKTRRFVDAAAAAHMELRKRRLQKAG